VLVELVNGLLLGIEIEVALEFLEKVDEDGDVFAVAGCQGLLESPTHSFTAFLSRSLGVDRNVGESNRIVLVLSIVLSNMVDGFTDGAFNTVKAFLTVCMISALL
jgi:hypothetical protein